MRKDIFMIEFSYTLKDSAGLHARPSGSLARLAGGFCKTAVTATLGGRTADAKKLFPLLLLDAKCGDTVKFTIEGGDELAAFAAISDFFRKWL